MEACRGGKVVGTKVKDREGVFEEERGLEREAACGSAAATGGCQGPR